jgi:hypothetical protein
MMCLTSSILNPIADGRDAGQAGDAASILGGEPRDEGRRPDRPEAVRIARRRQAAGQGLDEFWPLVRAHPASWTSRLPVSEAAPLAAPTAIETPTPIKGTSQKIFFARQS